MGKAPRKPDPRKQLERSYDRLYALYESGEISPEDTDKLYDLDAQLRPGWEAQASRDEAQSQPMMYDPEVGVPDLGILPVADPLYEKARRLAEDYLPYQISNNLFGRPASQDFLDREGLLGITGVNLATRLIDAPRNSALGNPSQAGEDLAMGTIGLLGLLPGGRAAKEVAEGGVNAVRRAVTEPPQRVRDFLAGESGAMPVPFASQSDPAIDQAEEVLGLLRSGRESEITEQMLDMGDPVLNARLSEHLYRNYDLPMDYESRMARAAEMGALDEYHGTTTGSEMRYPRADFGSGTRKGTGFFTSSNPYVASSYADPSFGSVFPMMNANPPSGLASIDAAGDIWSQIPGEATVSRRGAEFPVSSYASGPADMGGVFNTNQIARGAAIEGDGGVRFLNLLDRSIHLPRVKDDPSVMREFQEKSSVPSTVTTRQDTRGMRSRFARFDPRLAHLRNLNASLAAAGVPLGLLAMSPEEEQY